VPFLFYAFRESLECATNVPVTGLDPSITILLSIGKRPPRLLFIYFSRLNLLAEAPMIQATESSGLIANNVPAFLVKVLTCSRTQLEFFKPNTHVV
jgi:hypothetical protein